MCITASGDTHVLLEVNVIIGNSNYLIIVIFPKIVKSRRFHNNRVDLIFLIFSSQFNGGRLKIYFMDSALCIFIRSYSHPFRYIYI